MPVIQPRAKNAKRDPEMNYWPTPELAKPVPIIHRGERKVSRLRNLEIIIDYPVHDEVIFMYRRQKGWTWQQIMNAIWRAYRRVYRNQKRYGVWGHGLRDLVLERVNARQVGNGSLKTHVRVTMFVGS